MRGDSARGDRTRGGSARGGGARGGSARAAAVRRRTMADSPAHLRLAAHPIELHPELVARRLCLLPVRLEACLLRIEESLVRAAVPIGGGGLEL